MTAIVLRSNFDSPNDGKKSLHILFSVKYLWSVCMEKDTTFSSVRFSNIDLKSSQQSFEILSWDFLINTVNDIFLYHMQFCIIFIQMNNSDTFPVSRLSSIFCWRLKVPTLGWISRKRQSNNVIISLHYAIPFFVFRMTLGNITKSLTESILWIFKHTWQCKYFVPANHFILKTRKDRYRMLFLFMKNDIKVKTIVQIHVVTEGRGMCVHFCI